MKGKLIHDVAGESFELLGTSSIGRTSNSAVTIADPRFSRRHALICRQNDGFWFFDLGSSNGSMINGRRVTTAQLLKDGDQIQIGNHQLRFQGGLGEGETFDTTLGDRTLVDIQLRDVILLVGGFTVTLSVDINGWEITLAGLETSAAAPINGGSGALFDVPFDFSDFTSDMRVAFTTQGNGGGSLDLVRVTVISGGVTYTDMDGMTDAYETANGTDINLNDAALDKDGLTNLQEFLGQNSSDTLTGYGQTLSGTADSDGDTLEDGEEVHGALNPWTAGIFGSPPGDSTNPNEEDSDGDGTNDNAEIANNTDPNNSPPNIIIYADDMGLGDMGLGDMFACGDLIGTPSPAAAPHMNALAAEGSLFTQTHSSNGWLLGICFWRKGREERVLAESMGEKKEGGRLQLASRFDQCVIATTVEENEDQIESFCRQQDWLCHRGSEHDVLDSYYQTALQYPAEREHVSSRMNPRPGLFKQVSIKNHIDESKNRWTLDAPEDRELLTAILSVKPEPSPWKGILELVEGHPEWSGINSEIEQKKI